MARILALEPDRQRAAILQQRLHGSLNATIVIATSADAAIAALVDDPPDLVLTSTLIAAEEDHRLSDYLRRAHALQHLPVLTIPPMVDAADVAHSSAIAHVVDPQPQLREAYDFEAVVTRIREALDEAAAQTRRPSVLQAQHAPLAPSEPPQVTDQELRSYCGLGAKQTRARRWSPDEIPWLTGVKFASGQELRLLNISRSGLLVESGIRMIPGHVTQFQLTGPRKDVFVTARVIRSRVSNVQSLGVHYASAAQFEQMLDVLTDPEPQAERPRDPRGHLQQLIERLQLDAARGASPADVRSRFEAGLRDLVAAREIRLREAPVVENDGRDSIYFAIARSNPPAVLQVTFEPNYRPGAEDFAALREASIAAASLLECTKHGGPISPAV